MSLEIKYTTDGKKVVVLANLNSQEKIVQEVFVSNGIEIPSGENFVVKSLHDAPVVSWKEDTLKKLEIKYEKDKKTYEELIKNVESEYYKRTTELKQKIKYIGSVLKNADEKSFELLSDFLCGNIKYVIIQQYSTIELHPIEEFNMMYENSIRLFSIFGKDDGTFQYRVGQYSDSSGGSYEIHLFKTQEEALVKLQDLLNTCTISESCIKTANKWGLKISKEKLDEYRKKEISYLEKNILSNQNSIATYEAKIKEINDKYN